MKQLGGRKPTKLFTELFGQFPQCVPTDRLHQQLGLYAPLLAGGAAARAEHA